MGRDGIRAPRFGLHLPLLYRPLGEREWRRGRTLNISRSGLLFRTDHPVAVDAPLEMRFVLPAGPTPTGVLCRGRVVRQDGPGWAATIVGYRLRRRDGSGGRTKR